jgi:hypothetical protein
MRSETLQPADRVRLIPLAVAASLAAYLAVRTAGAVGAVLVGSSAVLGAGLWLWLRSAAATTDTALVARLAAGALAITPALLSIYYAFSSGGFYPDSVALGVIVLSLLVVVRCALAREPFAGLGPGVLVPAGALALLAVWSAASALWSDSPGRALIEVDRILLYLLAFVLLGSLARDSGRLRLGIRATAAAFTLVAVAAFVSRVAPDVLETAESFSASRLNYPLTYWNALGIFCAVGMVLCLHLTASTREPRPVRVLAAGALPVLAATLLLTFSRGAVWAAGVGLVAYALLARPRGLLPALLAAGPATFFALTSTYDATLLASDEPTSAAAIAQGHDVAGTVIRCVLAALVLRALMLPVDRRLASLRLPDHRRRPVTRGAWVAALLVALFLAAALDAPGFVAERYDQFVNQPTPVVSDDQTRSRLGSTSNQGRLHHWEVALKGFEAKPLTGSGAGTFAIFWNQHRDNPASIVNAHSLYMETLGELGIVGTVLLLVALGSILVRLAPFGRGRDRSLYGVLFAATGMWALHAAVDWDWEMPAATLWLFGLAGLALARGNAGERVPARRPHGAVLGAIGLAALLIAIVSGMLLASQNRLDESVTAYYEGDCEVALRDARRSSDWLGLRPEAHEMQGICLAALADYEGAVRAFERALERDPHNWGVHSSLAASLAATRRDPRPHAREGLRLNPLDPQAQRVARELRGRDPVQWRDAGRPIARTLTPSGRW